MQETKERLSAGQTFPMQRYFTVTVTLKKGTSASL